jgi:GntR family transcriptional regulator
MRETTSRRQFAPVAPSVTPLYHQLYLQLRQKIRSGEFDPSKPLPGEHQLAEQFGVSRVTVRRTLDNLELEGLVHRRRGVGTFPVARPTEFRDRYNIGGLIDAEARGGAAPRVATIESRMVLAPREVAARFGANVTELYRVVRVRSVGADPFTVMTSYLARPYGDRFTRRQLHGLPIPAALEEMGADLARAEQTINATLADERSAGLLRVPVGSPLVEMTTLFADRRDQAVAYLNALYRPDRYEYRTTMLRRSSGKSRRWVPAY